LKPRSRPVTTKASQQEDSSDYEGGSITLSDQHDDYPSTPQEQRSFSFLARNPSRPRLNLKPRTRPLPIKAVQQQGLQALAPPAFPRFSSFKVDAKRTGFFPVS